MEEKFYYCHTCKDYVMTEPTPFGKKCVKCGTIGMDLLSVLGDHDNVEEVRKINANTLCTASGGWLTKEEKQTNDWITEERRQFYALSAGCVYELLEELPLNEQGKERRRIIAPEQAKVYAVMGDPKETKKIKDTGSSGSSSSLESSSSGPSSGIVFIVVIIIFLLIFFLMPKTPTAEDALSGKVSYDQLSDNEKDRWHEIGRDAREQTLDYLYGA